MSSKPGTANRLQWLGLLVLLTGCADVGERWDEGLAISWPSDPSEARIEYVGSVSGLEERRQRGFWGTLLVWIRGTGEDATRLVRPVGLGVDATSRLHIVDQATRKLHVLDPRGFVVETIDLTGVIDEPVDVAIDRRGVRYLSDPRQPRLVRFDSEGRRLTDLTHPELRRPTGLAYDAIRDQLLIADTLGHRIFRFRSPDDLAPSFGARGGAPGSFNYPVYLTVSPSGDVWVTDSMNFRVCREGTDGREPSCFGELGDGPGSFARPKGVSVDRDGHVYVVDALFGNCQVFDDTGTLLLRFGTTGDAPGAFSLPTDIAIDDDRIFIADTYNRRVQVFRYLGPPPDLLDTDEETDEETP